MRLVSLNSVVSEDLELLSGDECHSLVLQHTSSDLRTFGVKHDGAREMWSLLKGVTEILDRSAVCFMVTMGEVESSNVHTSVQHFDKVLNGPARWTESTYNF